MTKPEVLIATIGIGGWYPAGVARLIQTLRVHSPGYEPVAWVNTYPDCLDLTRIVDGYDYGPYIAKPFALRHLRDRGAKIGILIDAAFYAVNSLDPLVEHIQREKYYLCRNGNNVGEWSSDECLKLLRLPREAAFGIEEISSYCVGLNFTDERCNRLLDMWCALAGIPGIFDGPHSTVPPGRNPGFVSADPRVLGHRHDQTALSITAHRLGMNALVERPRFTSYYGKESHETVLVNKGGL